MNSKEKIKNTYKQLLPSAKLNDFVEVYWEHQNLENKANRITIFPDSFFKLIIELTDGKIIAYFLTGIWTKEIEITVPPKTTVYGIKFKILAPEYIFRKEIASLLLSRQKLELDFFNIKNIKFDSFQNIVEQFEEILIDQLKLSKTTSIKKLELSQILYKMEGNITTEEIANKINWSNRQINRYLNKYLGVSLKTYLNIQKCYLAYIQIREGRFYPDDGYYDQAHFIKEIKKHTGQTPKKLNKEQNDRFIQLKNISKK